MKAKILAICIIAIIGIIALAGCAQPEEKTITIGAIFPLTGGLSQYGEAAMNSALIAADEINASGGINGKTLVIDFQDHKCDPATALSIFEQETGAKNIRVFTSAACSGTVLSLAPLMEKKESMLVGILITTPKISGSSPNIFRNWSSDAKEAKLFADYAKEKQCKKIGVLYEETDYAKGLKISLENDLKDSGIEVTGESFVSGSNDLRGQITKLKSEEIDCLFLSPQTVTSGEIMLKQLTELDFKPGIILVNDNITKSVKLITENKGIIEGAIGADYVIETNGKISELMQKYKEKFGIDCPQENVCASSYDTIKMIAAAVKEKGYNADAVRDYLKTNSFNGITGSIAFDARNDRANTEYSLFEIKNGKAEQMK
ncbi:MAG: ABC transporter substrate-binding protein [Candidatus ainarchaeum sp.]|nr:ABC transporter substrate-binding protein [Candidatus ainarchaeum sp.]